MLKVSSHINTDPALASPDIAVGRAQPGRRFVAACAYDYLICFWLAVALCTLADSFGIHDISSVTVAVVIFLARDYFFEGRGVGKNLLGMQVLDVRSGRPASLHQSVLRNLVILSPYFAYQFVCLSLYLMHVPSAQTQTVLFAAKVITTLWGIVVLLIEGFFMHRAYAGLRLADRVAGTVVVKATTDFRNPFSITTSELA